MRSVLAAVVVCSALVIAGCHNDNAGKSAAPFRPTTGTVTVKTCNQQTTQYLGYTLCERPTVCVSNTRTDCLRWNDLLSFLTLIRPPQAFDNTGIVPNKINPQTRFTYEIRPGPMPHDVSTFAVSAKGIRPNAEIADPVPVECSVGDFGGPTCVEDVVVTAPPCDSQCADQCTVCQNDPIDYPDPNGGYQGNGGNQQGGGDEGGGGSGGGNNGGNPDDSSPPGPTVTSDGSTTSVPIPTQDGSPSTTAPFCQQMSDDLVLACNNRKEAVCTLAAVAGAKGGTMAGTVAGTICKMYYNTICQQWKSDPCGKDSFTVWFGYRPRGASGPVIGFGTEP